MKVEVDVSTSVNGKVHNICVYKDNGEYFVNFNGAIASGFKAKKDAMEHLALIALSMIELIPALSS